MNVETIRPSQSSETLGNSQDPEGLAQARKIYLHEATGIAEEAVKVTLLQAEQKGDAPYDLLGAAA